MGDTGAVVEQTSLADRFVLALSTFDADTLARILASDAVAWRNVGDRTRSADEIVASVALERELIRSASVHVRHQSGTEDGFVVQFVFEGITRGGLDFSLPICIVAHVVDDRISRFEEYTDGACMEPLRQELLAHNSTGGDLAYKSTLP